MTTYNRPSLSSIPKGMMPRKWTRARAKKWFLRAFPELMISGHDGRHTFHVMPRNRAYWALSKKSLERIFLDDYFPKRFLHIGDWQFQPFFYPFPDPGSSKREPLAVV